MAKTGKKPLTYKEACEKVKLVHGDRYGLEKLEYINSYTAVILFCKIHGEFSVVPSVLFRGGGCYKCGRIESGKKRRAGVKKTFIERSNKIHNFKYDYSKTEYERSTTPVIITCPKHGDFLQKSNEHLIGKGCKKCGDERLVKIRRSTTEEFIKKAKKLHGDKYDYSKVKYLTADKQVIIICNKHGEFSQAPSAHLKPHGCAQCAVIKTNRNNMTSFDDFVFKSRKAQGAYADRYVVQEKGFYSSGDSSITVYCKEHDYFWDTLKMNFLKGRGCPRCHSSSYEKLVMKCLDDRSLRYVKEIVFKDLVFEGFLRFDFYIPSLSICLEVNGAQHYKAVNFYGGQEEFEKMKKRDAMKREYCENNFLHLEIIRYDDDIEKKTNEILKKYIS